MKRTDALLEEMEKTLNQMDIGELEKAEIMKSILKSKEETINLMITGATGCGKSSTINALFATEKAKVGIGVDPETMEIQKYDMDKLILWDSPGLGDGKEKDEKHTANIREKLQELDENGNPLIDLVLVILDGSSRDLGTSYQLINRVIIPCLGENAKDRIIVAINQCDVAMKGRYWDYDNNKPEPKLKQFLAEKVESVKRRISEGTGVDITPIYYSAGFKDFDETQCAPYNLTKLLHYIVKYSPVEKRMALVDNISYSSSSWYYDDGEDDYVEEVQNDITKTVETYAERGSRIGGAIGGAIAGSVGKTVGSTIGRAIGGAVKAAKSFFSNIFK